jgi:hypothetical protein
MALTAHQLIHINAMLDDITDLRSLTKQERNKWAAGKKLPANKMKKFLDRLEAYLLDLRDVTQVWPEITLEDGTIVDGEDASEIHDYLEKRIASFRA